MAKFSKKTKYVRTDGSRGYEEPLFAVCGANDTGTYSDSPCPSDVADKELKMAGALLHKHNIPYRQMVCQSSNVFCVHRYLIVPEEFLQKGREVMKEFVESVKSSTRLLYSVN